MIEVVTFSASGGRIDTAEAETPEDAVCAGRVLARPRVIPVWLQIVIAAALGVAAVWQGIR